MPSGLNQMEHRQATCEGEPTRVHLLLYPFLALREQEKLESVRDVSVCQSYPFKVTENTTGSLEG